MLALSNLRTELTTDSGTVRPVDGVDLHIGDGEAVALVGESGCGKSMTALSVMRLLPPNGRVAAGTVMLDGQDLLALPEAQMRAVRGRRIAMVFQDPASYLDPLMRVGDQISEAVRIRTGLDRRRAQALSKDALAQVKVASPERVAQAYPHELSGGMRQRVVIAIAIAQHPALIIADEPTTALDVTIQAEVMDLLMSLRQTLGLSILLVTHDLGLVAKYCDRIYVMYAGHIVEEAATLDLFGSPQHPYSRALLGSTLSIENRARSFATIPGQPPRLADLPSGCRFHPRCPNVMPICIGKPPPVAALNSDRSSRCWLQAPGVEHEPAS